MLTHNECTNKHMCLVQQWTSAIIHYCLAQAFLVNDSSGGSLFTYLKILVVLKIKKTLNVSI